MSGTRIPSNRSVVTRKHCKSVQWIHEGQTVTLFCDDVLNDVNFGQLRIWAQPSRTIIFHRRDIEEFPLRWSTAMLLRLIRKPHSPPHNADPIPATIRICNTRCGA